MSIDVAAWLLDPFYGVRLVVEAFAQGLAVGGVMLALTLVYDRRG